jgi:6-phosphofructokinase 1
MTAAVVTCGGLCPGLNNVVRSLFLELHHNYGVRKILGIRYGYAGLNPAVGLPPCDLTPELVEDIHQEGGTVLGSSRGPQPVDVMVDFLADHQVDMLFCVGGDGTLRGARDLAEEAKRRRSAFGGRGHPEDHRQRYHVHDADLRGFDCDGHGVRDSGLCPCRGTQRL